jgi:hypothetical protein
MTTLTGQAAGINAVIATLAERLPEVAKSDPQAYDRIVASVDLDLVELHVLRDTAALAFAEGRIDLDAAQLLQKLLGGWLTTTTVAGKIAAMQTVGILAQQEVAA